MEWTPTFGLALRTRSLQLRYNYSVSCSVSECITIGRGDAVTVAAPAPASTGGVIAAPSSALTFNGGTASTHKIWVSIPIR